MFVPAAFHPTRRAGTLFGVPVTRETYKDVLYDYDGSVYRPSGLRTDNPEMRVTFRCKLCGTRRFKNRVRWLAWLPEGSRNGKCQHVFRYTGVVVRVLRPNGTLAWRRPWLLRPGDRVYTDSMHLNDVGWGRPKGTFRVVLCRPLKNTNAHVNPNGAQQFPATARQLFGNPTWRVLAKA